MCRTKSLKEVIEKASQAERESRDARTLLDKRLLEVEIDSKKQEQRLQKWFAYWAVGLVSLWLVFIVAVVFSVGMSWLNYSDGVLIALLATTTANIIGLAYFMAKGLFPNK